MLKKFLALVIIFSLIALSACTGTKEEGTASLLFVAYQGIKKAEIALVEDKFFVDGASGQRLQFLKKLNLPATAIAYDVIDRLGDRSQLVILTGDGSRYFISFYNMKINPNNLSDFKLIGRDIHINSLNDKLDFAPNKIQISKDGKYIAIMNSFKSNAKDDAIDIIDVSDRTKAKLLKRLDSSIVSTALFMPQNNQARLYYLRKSVSAVLNYIDIPSLLNTETKIKIPDSESIENEVKDMGQIAQDLVVLQNKQLSPINSFDSSPSLGDSISTGSSNDKLIPNNSFNLSNIIVLAKNKLTIHSDISDTSPKDMDISLIDGTVEPFGGFVYFLNSNSTRPLTIFDLQRFNGDSSSEISNNIRSFRVYSGNDTKALDKAVFVTWAKAFVPNTP